MKICPHCYRSLKTRSRSHARRHTFEMSTSSPWLQPGIQSTPSQGPYTEIARRTPTRAPTVDSDVFVPSLQSFMTACVVAIVTIPLSLLMTWPWYTPLITFCLALPLAWFSLLGDQRRSLWSIETIINEDLNGDGQIGRPSLPAPRIEVEVKEGPVTQMHDLPGPFDQLETFARGVLDKRWSFSERGAASSGYGVPSFRELRKTFITRGWAAWNNPRWPQQGASLTHKGTQIISIIAGPPFENGTPSARAHDHVQTYSMTGHESMSGHDN